MVSSFVLDNPVPRHRSAGDPRPSVRAPQRAPVRTARCSGHRSRRRMCRSDTAARVDPGSARPADDGSGVGPAVGSGLGSACRSTVGSAPASSARHQVAVGAVRAGAPGVRGRHALAVGASYRAPSRRRADAGSTSAPAAASSSPPARPSNGPSGCSCGCRPGRPAGPVRPASRLGECQQRAAAAAAAHRRHPDQPARRAPGWPARRRTRPARPAPAGSARAPSAPVAVIVTRAGQRVDGSRPTTRSARRRPRPARRRRPRGCATTAEMARRGRLAASADARPRGRVGRRDRTCRVAAAPTAAITAAALPWHSASSDRRHRVGDHAGAGLHVGGRRRRPARCGW